MSKYEKPNLRVFQTPDDVIAYLKEKNAKLSDGDLQWLKAVKKEFDQQK